jgi:UTP-glucose-1-phosphate uridylyltransferase
MYSCIIPAAGFGTRVGMLPHEAKELLPDPVDGRPLICYAIDGVIKAGIYEKIVIILRTEKVELKERLEALYPGRLTYVIFDEPNKEWPHSVLASQAHWSAAGNLLILPDTRFEPKDEVIAKLPTMLTRPHVIAFALHVIDPAECSKFGIVEPYGFTAEKPEASSSKTAWGLIAFKPNDGVRLFNAYSNRGEWFNLGYYYSMNLEYFKDITREKALDTVRKIE